MCDILYLFYSRAKKEYVNHHKMLLHFSDALFYNQQFLIEFQVHHEKVGKLQLLRGFSLHQLYQVTL